MEVSTALLMLMLFARHARKEKPGDSMFVAGANSTANSKVTSADTTKEMRQRAPASETADAVPAESRPDDYVPGRVAELLDLAMTDDPASLSAILAELSNPNEEIREAAVLATIEFKSADAIPALVDAYNRTEEPEQKLCIRKAIDFLKTGQ